MLLKAHMIELKDILKIDVETKEPLVEGIRILENKYYKEGTVLGLDNKGPWYTYTHYRGKNNHTKKYCQLGFELIDFDNSEKDQSYNLFISANDSSNLYPLKYDKINNIYFELPKGVIKDGKFIYNKSTESVTAGIDTAGIFYIDVFDSNETNVYTSPPIYVLPSSMSYIDYKIMLDDLLQIKDDLVINEKAKAGFEGNWNYRRCSIIQCLEKINNPLKRINKNPTTSLSTEWKKESFKSIKNIKSRTLIEKELMPFKNKYHVQTHTESADICENRMIKYALIKLKDKVIKYSNTYFVESNKKEQETNKIKKNIEKRYGTSVEIKLEELNTNIKAKEKEIIEYERGFLAENKNKIDSVLKNQSEISGNIDIEFNIYQKSDFDEKNIEVEIGIKTCKVIINRKKSKNLCLNYENYRYNINGSWKTSKFDANVGTIQIESSNLNEVTFLIEKVFENKDQKSLIQISARGESTSQYPDDPLGGKYLPEYSENRTHKDYIIKLRKIYSINGEEVPEYELDYIINKLLLYKDGNKLDNLKQHLDNLKEEKSLLGSIVKQSEIANKNKMRFLNQDKNWEFIISQIDSFLDLDFFKEVKYIHSTWKPTQVFMRDPNYNVLYKHLKDLDYKIDFISEFDSKGFAVKVTHSIYEYWCFFKMIQILVNEQKWDLENHNEITEWLNSNNKKDGDLKAILSHIVKDNRQMKLTIYNNKKIYYTTHDEPKIQRHKRPDYALDFQYEGSSRIVYIDAKYRNYTEQKRSQWIDDIKNVAIDNYIKTFRNALEGKENEPMSSFIVHPDTGEDWTFYGGDLENGLDEDLGWYNQASKHKFGSFSFVPSQTINFRTFFKMLLEYQLELYDYCWNCGETVHSKEKIKKEIKNTERGYEKYHYTCNTCGAFWVKNHCLFMVISNYNKWPSKIQV